MLWEGASSVAVSSVSMAHGVASQGVGVGVRVRVVSDQGGHHMKPHPCTAWKAFRAVAP